MPRKSLDALAIALTLTALTTACKPAVSVAQSHPATVQRPVSEQTPVRPFESGSRKYKECVATAGDDAQAQEHCLDEELAYQQRSLDGLYQDLEAKLKLDKAQREALHAEQHAWQQETDRLCGPAAGAPPVDQVCRLDRIDTRYSVLNYRLSNTTERYLAEDTPDANGAMEMRLGDAMITMQSDGCTVHAIAGGLNCSNARLQVSTSTLRRQMLSLPEVWLPRTVRPDYPATTGFRGSLDADFVEIRYGIVLSDINADKYEDLIVWTGRDGSHDGPSYTYYLYDAKTRRLVENPALAKLMEGHSLLRIVDGRLFAWYHNRPCDRGEKLIEVRGSTPRIVARRDYTTCGEGAISSDELSDDSWMRTPEGETTP